MLVLLTSSCGDSCGLGTVWSVGQVARRLPSPCDVPSPCLLLCVDMAAGIFTM